MHAPLPEGFVDRPIAHRGLHDREAGRIENSAAAFDAALAAGYGIELDVQLSGDGRAVVFHDATLDRLTAEVGPVSRRSAGELGGVTLAGSSDTIPTLSATLSQVAGRVPLLIELKDRTGELGPSDGRLERAVAADLRDYQGPLALMSFSPTIVAVLAGTLPEVPRGLATDAFDAGTWPGVPPERLAELRRIDVEAVGAAFVSHEHRDLASPRLAELRAAGLPLLTWTIRSPAEAEAALRAADAITFEGFRPALGDATRARA